MKWTFRAYRVVARRWAGVGVVWGGLVGGAAAEDVAVAPPAPFGVVPSARQLAWHELEFYGFLHFTVNTFTGREWGYGDESPAIFNPVELDARQWAAVARDAGMKGLILTAKHHDGFCLWPSQYTEHSVRRSPWRGGQGDVLRELSEACRETGLRMGVYLSPWDRNHAAYGTPEYVTYYRNQLTELLTQYGEIFEVWHDGANGGDGYYGGAREDRRIDKRTYYGWPETWALVRELQPGAVIFSDAGPDIRWIGNERGIAPDPCWARIDPEGIIPGEADVNVLARGNPNGLVWRPAEVDVSIRKGWFYHPEEEPKSLEHLLDIYYRSVGNGCCLLLNLTPDKRGLIPEADVARLREFRAVLDATFAHDLAAGRAAAASNHRGPGFEAIRVTDGDRQTYWAATDDARQATVTVELPPGTTFNRVRIQEYIALGQRVAAFAIEAHGPDGWHEVATGHAIGARRILRLPETTADAVRLSIRDALASPTLSTFEVYHATSEPEPTQP
jgi:alpha-L-fucosidase